MFGSSHYITSVCALPPSAQYPSGLILAGSNDCAIYGFVLESTWPVLRLLGHSENVCALVAGNLGIIISGSCDRTARVWLGHKCVMILTGHKAGIRAVALLPEESLVLTGSADKEIRLWQSATGLCERVYIGHEDTVRELAVISNDEFISCSDDSTIRRWETSGNCIGIYTGHTDYIYGLAVPLSGDKFVSCSGDQTVKIWQHGFCQQSMTLPSKSIWSVSYLKNSDIVVGGSDGAVTVFTKHRFLIASASDVIAYNKLYKSSQKQSVEDFDVVRHCYVLANPGAYDGQNQLCREGSEIYAHQWSASEQKWIKIGQVYDATENKQLKSKTVFEGQEYDYVFTIDAEGKFLKLPFNLADDPWLSALKFIDKHDLNITFVEQITNFIINNSKDDKKETDPKAANSMEFSDLFTGIIIQEKETKNIFFPQSSFVTFDFVNIDLIKAKLIECSKHVDKQQMLSKVEISDLVFLSSLPSVVTDQQMATLEKIVNWPQDFMFPALDLFRVVVKGKAVNSQVSEIGGITLVNHLLSFLSDVNPVSNVMLTLRALCNFFVHTPGETLLVKHIKNVLDMAKPCSLSKHNDVQISLATLYLNYSVTFHKFPNSEYSTFCALEALQSLFVMTEPEAIYRLLVCVGTAIHDSKAKSDLQSLNVVNSLQCILAGIELPKIKSYGKCLMNCLKEY